MSFAASKIFSEAKRLIKHWDGTMHQSHHDSRFLQRNARDQQRDFSCPFRPAQLWLAKSHDNPTVPHVLCCALFGQDSRACLLRLFWRPFCSGNDKLRQGNGLVTGRPTRWELRRPMGLQQNYIVEWIVGNRRYGTGPKIEQFDELNA